MSNPIDASSSSDEGIDEPIPEPPNPVPIRPVYLKVLAAAVVMTILGSPTLVRLGEMFNLGAQGWLHTGPSGMALGLTLGTLVLGPLAILRLRSQGRELSRSYGVSGILGAMIGVLFAGPNVAWGVFMLSSNRALYRRTWPYHLDQFARSALEFPAVAIASAWLILALAGVGRRPSNGFECLGLALGASWVLTYVVRYVLNIVPWLL